MSGANVKKYTDIVRMGHRDTVGVVKEGDYITVYEKLDGANASFTVDTNGSAEVLAFSRNTQLSPENNLRGFYEFTRGIDPFALSPRAIYYGEWLVKHKVDYGDNAGVFYLFDIYDKVTESYVPTNVVIEVAERLSLAIAPILYAGPYVSYEHLQSFVGRSAYASTPDGGEGVVVKNVNFRDRFGKQTFMKLVSDGFREIQPQKAPRDPNTVPSAEAAFVQTFMTEGRVDKLLRKLVDEALIPEDFGLEDMGAILRELGGRVYDDLFKEERESLPEEFNERDIRKSIGKKLPLIIRSIITESTTLKEAA